MQRARVIVVLLIKDGGLYKGVKFKNHNYIGDPINTMKIFNEKEVDEIAIIDIGATPNKKAPDISMITTIASESFMPLAYGGGITTLDQIKNIFYAGVEKVIINTSHYKNLKLIEEAAAIYGNQSIVAAIDVKKSFWGKEEVYIGGGKIKIPNDPIAYAQDLVNAGAGEIMLQSIDLDGTYAGFDIPLLKKMTSAVRVPVIASCGAGSLQDLRKAVVEGGASAVAAGSLFVFIGAAKGILMNYPSQEDLKMLFA
jgi:cyclase